MSDRGILFSAPMILAIFAGRKTQTRRLLRNPEFHGCPTGDCPHNLQAECDAAMAAISDRDKGYVERDRLWVREAFSGPRTYDGIKPKDWPRDMPCIRYHADDYRTNPPHPVDEGRGRPSIHLPRFASRLTLLVTEVRVQRLREISGADARAEGVEHDGQFNWRDYEGRHPHMLTPRESFATLWDSLGRAPGDRWSDNPWVVAVSFEARQANIDQLAA